jgi:hypothetical protein
MPGMKASSKAPRDGKSHSQQNQTHFPKSTERNHNCSGKKNDIKKKKLVKYKEIKKCKTRKYNKE